MALMANYVDGKLQTSSTSSDSLSKNKKDNSVVDSDTFLTLLVAEMQNQDPLEPTSNTEWVSQYATFTQVEQIGEMRDSMDTLRANSMVGKEVIMAVTSESTGETNYVRGTVDYVTIENGEPYLVINEEKYSIDDLDSVASEEYFTAYDKYSEFVSMMDALPNLNVLDTSYKNTIGEVYDLYNGLDEYQKEYVNKYASGYVESYKAYISKMEQLGITYGETTTADKTTTLNDVLEAFNQKMDSLMSQIGSLSSSSQSADSGSADVATNDDAESAVNDNAESTNGTQDSESTQDTSQAAEENEENEASDDMLDQLTGDTENV